MDGMASRSVTRLERVMTLQARTLQKNRRYPSLPKQVHFEEINSGGSPSGARKSKSSKGLALMAATFFILEYAVSFSIHKKFQHFYLYILTQCGQK